ncbi:tannase and feruloyl esterase [Thozetella sp. PMI_491]|nr:tannase and feruloyl esterase [Thozetella sp. PMI_491]
MPLLSASIVAAGFLALCTHATKCPNSPGFRDQCLSLANNVVINGASSLSSEFVEANSTLFFPDADPSCGRTSQAVSVNLCRLTAQVATSSRSSIRLEVWLPEQWTGRFLSTGNGGLGGCVQYEDIEYAASLGFATVGTNNGHDGMSGQAFLHNPDIIEDFAYRALHTGVVLGKDISRAFYGKAHSKSYYLGCSTGGRQGFKEVQTFPEDFDGVVAGAPAFAFNNLTSWSCHFLPLTGPSGSASFIPLDMWPIIHQEVLNQCDALDGLVDGILEAPDLCNFDATTLVCVGGQTQGCLTQKQAETLRSIFSPLLDEEGSLVYPRLQPGAELTGAPQTYFTGQPFGAADWFRYVIFNDSAWDPFSLIPDDYVLSSHLNPFDIETWKGDLSAFKQRGGKLLHYHGLADGTISSDNSPRYYEHAAQEMGLTPQGLDEFYRLFRISGMGHCGGGPGAHAIGNQKGNSASLDPDENVLMAIVRWVEEGIAPDRVIGTAYVNGTASAGVDYKRAHCRWPYRNVYPGIGDPKDLNSWHCVLDKPLSGQAA